MFIFLWNHHHHPFDELILSCENENLSLLNNKSQFLSPTHPWKFILLYHSMILFTLSSSYKQTMAFIYSWLAYYTLHIFLKVLLCYSICQNYLPFKANTNVYVCVYVCVFHILLIHLSINGHWVCFHLLTIVKNAAINMDIQLLF